MSTKKDYYEILGVNKQSTEAEIKSAYRNLVKQYHPDRVEESKKKEAEEKFKEISESYAVLSDSKKRQLYDQYGHAGIDSRFSTEDIFRGANFSDFSDIFGGGGGIFDDIFSSFGFGGGFSSSGRRSRQGEDLRYEYQISLEEAAKGIEKDLKFARLEKCDSCNGEGIPPGTKKITCGTCNGRGVVASGFGFINFQQTCPTCNGQGQVSTVKCSSCRGQGRVRVDKSIKVTVPAGVDTGSVLRLKNEGNYANGGYGDLYLHLSVKRHPVFQRVGNDLKNNVKVSMVKAALGGDIEVATLDKKVMMSIPAGTQPGSIFRLRGKGIMDLHTKRTGDQLVEVEVEIPKKISSKEKKVLQEFGKLRNEL